MATLDRKIVDVILPSFLPEEVHVQIYDKLIAMDTEDVDFSKLTSVQSTFATYAKAVKSWDLKDSEGKPLPVTYENVRKLPLDDIEALTTKTHIKGQLETIKKNSSYSTSTPTAK
jgi:hypothetical protein